MHTQKIGKDLSVLPCAVCQSSDNLEFQWRESAGHGDSSFEGLQIYCCGCGYGVGSANGYGSPGAADKSVIAEAWNKFMNKFSVWTKVKKAPIVTKEKPRMFQVLDEMNLDDVENKTKMLQISTTYINMRQESMGCGLIMNVPCSAQFGIENGVTIPILIVVNKEEYFKRKGDGK